MLSWRCFLERRAAETLVLGVVASGCHRGRVREGGAVAGGWRALSGSEGSGCGGPWAAAARRLAGRCSLCGRLRLRWRGVLCGRLLWRRGECGAVRREEEVAVAAVARWLAGRCLLRGGLLRWR